MIAKGVGLCQRKMECAPTNGTIRAQPPADGLFTRGHKMHGTCNADRLRIETGTVSPMSTRVSLVCTVLLTSLLASCGPMPGVDGGVPPGDTYPSGAPCPDGSTLTYESFGQNFFTTYCIRCHSVANVGSIARNGAPEDVNFDTIELIRPLARRIDFMAAIGPNREGRIMPLNGLRPSDAEREDLGRWLACGAP